MNEPFPKGQKHCGVHPHIIQWKNYYYVRCPKCNYTSIKYPTIAGAKYGWGYDPESYRLTTREN